MRREANNEASRAAGSELNHERDERSRELIAPKVSRRLRHSLRSGESSGPRASLRRAGAALRASAHRDGGASR